jgi:hypothetical protein
MNIQTFILTFVLTLFSSAALAGAGHDHGAPREPVTQQRAEQIASQVLSTFASKSNIDQSWNNIKVDKSEKKSFSGNLEWVVSYKNEAVSDPQKRTLYVFLTLGGEFIAANYTGE